MVVVVVAALDFGVLNQCPPQDWMLNVGSDVAGQSCDVLPGRWGIGIRFLLENGSIEKAALPGLCPSNGRH